MNGWLHAWTSGGTCKRHDTGSETTRLTVTEAHGDLADHRHPASWRSQRTYLRPLGAAVPVGATKRVLETAYMTAVMMRDERV